MCSEERMVRYVDTHFTVQELCAQYPQIAHCMATFAYSAKPLRTISLQLNDGDSRAVIFCPNEYLIFFRANAERFTLVYAHYGPEKKRMLAIDVEGNPDIMGHVGTNLHAALRLADLIRQ